MNSLRCVLILSLFASPAIAGTPSHSGAASKSPAFEKLQSLVGDWRAVDPARKGFKTRFERIAGGTTLIETLTEPDGSTMVTLYHSDGGKILLTHCCNMGDQPRMSGELAADSIQFTFVDVTNLKGPDMPHMHDLTISWKSKDHIVERWIVASGAKRTPLVLDLKRVNS